MVNQNIEGTVGLNGRGHTRKPSHGYTPGEYTRLVNAEIDASGAIVNRRPIRVCGFQYAANRRISNPCQFIGNIGQSMISVSNDSVWVHEPRNSGVIKLWDVSVLGSTSSNYHMLKKVIRYNNKNHFLSIRYANNVDGLGSDAWYVASKYIDWPSDALNEQNPGTVSWHQDTSHYTDQTLFSRISTIADPKAPLVFKDAFIHKDRLWVVTEDELFFSKATDPLDFNVPEGGFIKIPGVQINSVIANRDHIYVIGNGSIHVITYVTDPNVDSVVREITGALGGDSACLYEDSVYTVRDDSLYLVSPNSVTKIMDLQIGLNAVPGEYTKIASFGNYIVFQRWRRNSYFFQLSGDFNDTNLPHSTKARSHPVGTGTYRDSSGSNAFKYHMFFLNMDTGSIHVLDFRDAPERTLLSQGYIADMELLPVEDGRNNFHLFFMTKCSNSADTSLPVGAAPYTGAVYSMQVSAPSTDYYINLLDECVEGTSSGGLYALRQVEPAVDIEIKRYVPDGNEFKMKKFRSLLIQGQMPVGYTEGSEVPQGLEIQYAFDNREYGTAVPLLTTYNDSNLLINDHKRTDVSPMRIPINQRARSISIRIKKKGNVILNNSDYRQNWAIEDIKVLWGYTQRGPINRAQDRYLS
jgi:hypothetical protein